MLSFPSFPSFPSYHQINVRLNIDTILLGCSFSCMDPLHSKGGRIVRRSCQTMRSPYECVPNYVPASKMHANSSNNRSILSCRFYSEEKKNQSRHRKRIISEPFKNLLSILLPIKKNDNTIYGKKEIQYVFPCIE